MIQEIRRLTILAGLYAAASFTYSFVAFAPGQPAIHFHEYRYSTLLLELGGHVAFGMIAASVFLDAELIVLSGLLAVVIDVDHILATLNLATISRPAHSFVFVPLTFLLLAYAAAKSGMTDRWVKVAFLAPVVFFSHVAYDIFAAYVIFGGRGASFPLLAPFSFAMTTFQYSTWIWFEAGALLIAAVARAVTFKRRE
jgi:hypothetical protein